jgi:hypothetical protein
LFKTLTLDRQSRINPLFHQERADRLNPVLVNSAEDVYIDYGNGDIRRYNHQTGREQQLIPIQYRSDMIAWQHASDSGETFIITRNRAIRRTQNELETTISLPYDIKAVNR